MTELSDELLVAYVDGQLARDQTRAVDKVLDHDDVVARRVEALKQVHSRFECAFEAILAGEVSELMANAPALPPPVRRRQGNSLAKIGFGTAGLGLCLFALVAGYGWPLALSERAAPRADGVSLTPSDWQHEAVRAQALLSRDSVEVAAESQGNFDLVALQLAQIIGPAVKIPNLETQGFKFMRGQVLRFDGEPLAQLLYLGAGSAPLALYARRGGDKPREGFAMSGAIGAIAWSDDGITYLLAGEEDKATLLRLAETIRHEPSAAEPALPRKPSEN